MLAVNFSLISFEKLAAEEAATRDTDVEITVPASRPLGDQVIDAEVLGAIAQRHQFDKRVVEWIACNRCQRRCAFDGESLEPVPIARIRNEFDVRQQPDGK